MGISSARLSTGMHSFEYIPNGPVTGSGAAFDFWARVVSIRSNYSTTASVAARLFSGSEVGLHCCWKSRRRRFSLLLRMLDETRLRFTPLGIGYFHLVYAITTYLPLLDLPG